MTHTIRLFLLACVCFLSANIHAQTRADADLLNEISRIKAIDNHAHPLKYVPAGAKPDDEFDALPLDALEPFPLPLRLNPTNPEFIGAWRALYHYAHDDMSEAHMRELLSLKQRVAKERGDSFRRGFWINSTSKPCSPIASPWAEGCRRHGFAG